METLIIEYKTRENNQLEFKKAKGGLPNSFFETYSSFSNSKGGIIYLGLEELKDHTIVSAMLSDDEIIKLKTDLFSLLSDPKKVSVNLIIEDEVRVLEYSGYPVLEVRVNAAPREWKPVYINNNIMTGTFRRNDEGDYHCTPSEIKSMLRDAAERSEDLRVINEMGLDVLCKATIASYKNRFRSYNPDHVFLKNDEISFLELLGAVRKGEDEKYHPTVAGLLMFGYSYKIVYEFPEYFLDYQEHYSEGNDIRWTDRVMSDSGDWSGNMFDFYTKIANKLTSDIKVPFHMEGIDRVDETSLHVALREGLCNAISNADFTQRRGLVVKKYFDHIEYHNPGCLRIPAEIAFKGGDSDPRNKTILKMWNLVGVGERSGSGLPKILAACNEFGLPKPELYDEYNPDRSHLIIRLNKGSNGVFLDQTGRKDNSKLSKSEKEVLSYLLNNGDSKTKDIALALGFSLTYVKRMLYKLIAMELVSSKGKIKDKTYCLNKQDN